MIILSRNYEGKVFGWDSPDHIPADHHRLTEEEVNDFLNPPRTLTANDIAAKRYEVETSGVMIEGVLIDTDDRSKLLINGAAALASANPEFTLNWKTPDGFVQLTAEQVQGVAQAVALHVQACFDREAELLAELEAGTFTEAMLDQGWPVPQSS